MSLRLPFALSIVLGAMNSTIPANAQPASQQKTIGLISMNDARDVKFSGAVSVDESGMLVGNGSVVTAASRTAHVKLSRGGTVNVCATTSVQMTQASGSLMLSLDRGAVETRYAMRGAATSDIVQTPDLRILISSPGSSDVRVRVNGRGDTCVENRGDSDAPYVSVTPQLGDGLYRVDAGQRVLFERGNLREVVDHEPYPCGCPPDEQPKPDEFPLAVSQGLTPTPAMAGPVAAPGEVHAQVTANLVFDSQGAAPRDSDSSPDAIPAPARMPSAADRAPIAEASLRPPARKPALPVPRSETRLATHEPSAAVTAPAPASAQPKKNDVVHVVGRFFSRLFGKSRGAANQ